MTARLNELCRRSPLLIVLDDVHRADEMSLRLLAFVTDQIWPAPLGLVVAYRNEESADGMWKTVIPGISAYRRTRTLTLAGLDTSDIDEWLRRQRISAPELIPAGLRERSGGNPLFLSEIVRLVQVGRGDHIPPSVLQLMGARVSGLPAPTRVALDMAALLGRDFGYAALATALHRSPFTIVRDLEPAVEAGVLVHDPARQGGYRFSHLLIRDAVLDVIGPARRAELHAVALTALRDTGWGVPSDLAHHAVQARMIIGDSAAAEFTSAAAQLADRSLAWEDAARWWQATLELLPQEAPNQQGTLMSLGRSLLKCGQIAAARRCFERVALHAQAVVDDALLAEAALAIGDTIAEVAADAGLIRMLDDALAAPGVTDGVRVRLQARRAIAAYWTADGKDDALRRSKDAVAGGRLVADDGVLGAALIARQFTLRGPDHLAERIAIGEEASEIAARLCDDDLRFRSHQWLIPDRFQAGDIDGVRVELAAATAIADASRDPLRRWWVTIFNGLLTGFSGDDGETERCAVEGGALGRRLGQPAADVYQVAQLVPLFWRCGRLQELDSQLNRLVAQFPGLPTLRCDALLVLAETGRRNAALTGLRRLVANDFGLFRRDSLFLASLAILGCTAVSLGDVPRAQAILTKLAPYATRNLIQGVPVGWGSAAWHLGRLAALVGDERAAAKYQAVADDLHTRWMAGPWGPPAVEQTKGSLRAYRLSLREQLVLGLLADGRANKDIAASLGISVHTVERHVANVFGKLGVHNRAEATAWAVRHEIGQSTT